MKTAGLFLIPIFVLLPLMTTHSAEWTFSTDAGTRTIGGIAAVDSENVWAVMGSIWDDGKIFIIDKVGARSPI
ncbi:MAG: hypothetical protein RAO92_08640 [Candidatus Euphemobacter frigidus]|nr:hypothetical protein [Candidatus Euphemobacter frigidus]MDP8276454.1 hypothetical protein [Candidatus Euphemobacter frigidus]